MMAPLENGEQRITVKPNSSPYDGKACKTN